MAEPRRDERGQFRAPQGHEAILDALGAKHAAAAARIGLLHRPSPSSPSSPEQDIDRDLRRAGIV